MTSIRARALALSLAFTSLSLAGGAAAQEKGTDAGATPAVTADQLANRGFQAYEAGKFADAVGLYMQSFQISGDARILFNVASIYDKKLHDRALAEDFYRRYLRSSTTEPDLVKKANDRLREMKNERETLQENADAAAVAASSTRASSAAPVETESGAGRRIAGLVLGGVGLVGIGLGAGFGLSAASKTDDVKALCPNDVCRTAEGPALRDDASTAATLSTVLFAAGGAALVGGAILYFTAPRRHVGLRVAPSLAARSGGFTVVGEF